MSGRALLTPIFVQMQWVKFLSERTYLKIKPKTLYELKAWYIFVLPTYALAFRFNCCYNPILVTWFLVGNLVFGCFGGRSYENITK